MISVVAPVLLLPLFLRSEPLAPGALRSMADELVARSGLRVRDIRLLMMSEKTTSANAAVVGLGPTRRILLGDTLTGDEDDDGGWPRRAPCWRTSWPITRTATCGAGLALEARPR